MQINIKEKSILDGVTWYANKKPLKDYRHWLIWKSGSVYINLVPEASSASLRLLNSAFLYYNLMCMMFCFVLVFLSASGQMPATVQVDQNKLLVKKVDETVNTTFVCEVKNSLGSVKKEFAIIVIGEYVHGAGMPQTDTHTHRYLCMMLKLV